MKATQEVPSAPLPNNNMRIRRTLRCPRFNTRNLARQVGGKLGSLLRHLHQRPDDYRMEFRGVATVPFYSISSGSSSMLRLGGDIDQPAKVPHGVAGRTTPPTLDRSGEGSALSVLRTLLRNPPESVKDDAHAQAWLEGLICMTDNAIQCNESVRAEANRISGRSATRAREIRAGGATDARS